MNCRPGHGLHVRMPEGFTSAGLERLHGAAARHVGDDRVPGLVAIVARDAEVHVEALGSLTIGGGPVTRDSIFRIASTTKPVTAAATLAVAAEGLIELDEPVDRLLPELAERPVLRRMDGPLDDTVPVSRPITARDLLTFTFGFGMTTGMFRAATPWPVVAAAEELNLASVVGDPGAAAGSRRHPGRGLLGAGLSRPRSVSSSSAALPGDSGRLSHEIRVFRHPSGGS